MKARKAVLPKLWSVLKSGGSGCATMIFPNLLPFLSKVPSEVCIYTLNTYFAAIIITWYFTVLFFFFFQECLGKKKRQTKTTTKQRKNNLSLPKYKSIYYLEVLIFLFLVFLYSQTLRIFLWLSWSPGGCLAERFQFKSCPSSPGFVFLGEKL